MIGYFDRAMRGKLWQRTIKKGVGAIFRESFL